MRKQYHFRPSQNGYFAWDVDRLIQLSSAFPVRKLPTERITELDELYWFAHEDTPTCRRIADHFQLMSEADLRYPIILCAEGRLMDGMHRVTKALVSGVNEVRCVQFEVTPEPDFVDVQPKDLPNTRPSKHAEGAPPIESQR